MHSHSEHVRENQSVLISFTGWTFGIIFLSVGLINTFWGNDTGYGLLIVLASLVFFPPVNTRFKEMLGFSIPVLLKVVTGLFIVWTALGVGELFGKIEMMVESFK